MQFTFYCMKLEEDPEDLLCSVPSNLPMQILNAYSEDEPKLTS